MNKVPDCIPFSEAAQILDCTPEFLLHLGAIEKIRVAAPVLAEGFYRWGIETFGVSFPTIDNSIIRHFDRSDRIYMVAEDLRVIEAGNGVVPKIFFCDYKARQAIEYAASSLLSGEHPYICELNLPGFEVSIECLRDELSQLTESEANAPSMILSKFENGVEVQEYLTKRESIIHTIKLIENRSPDLSRADEQRLRAWVVQTAMWQMPEKDKGRKHKKTKLTHLFIFSEEIEWIRNEILKEKSIEVGTCSTKNDAILNQPINEPWWEENLDDPKPSQNWYTPARYFARGHVKNDPKLEHKRQILAQKVSVSLKEKQILKRGGTKPLNASTILKALSKVNLTK